MAETPARRRELTDLYERLVRELSLVLDRHDPLAIAEDNPGEYEPEARDIAWRLFREARTGRRGAADAQRIFREVFAEWFGPEYASGLKAEAAEAWVIYERLRGQLPSGSGNR